MSPPDPGGRGGAGNGAVLSEALILAGFFWHKYGQFILIELGANDHFSDPN